MKPREGEEEPVGRGRKRRMLLNGARAQRTETTYQGKPLCPKPKADMPRRHAVPA